MTPLQIGSMLLVLIVAGFAGIPITAISYFISKSAGRELSVPITYALVVPNGALGLLALFGGESDGIPFMGSFIWASPLTLFIVGLCINVLAGLLSRAPVLNKSN